MSRHRRKKEVEEFIVAGTHLGLNSKVLAQASGLSPGSVRIIRHQLKTKWRDSTIPKPYHTKQRAPHWIALRIIERMAQLGHTTHTLRKANPSISGQRLNDFFAGRGTVTIPSLERMLKALGLKLTIDEET